MAQCWSAHVIPAVLDRMDESPSLETVSLKLGLIDFQKAALYIMYHVPDFMENSQYDKLLQKSTHFRGGKKRECPQNENIPCMQWAELAGF